MYSNASTFSKGGGAPPQLPPEIETDFHTLTIIAPNSTSTRSATGKLSLKWFPAKLAYRLKLSSPPEAEAQYAYLLPGTPHGFAISYGTHGSRCSVILSTPNVTTVPAPGRLVLGPVEVLLNDSETAKKVVNGVQLAERMIDQVDKRERRKKEEEELRRTAEEDQKEMRLRQAEDARKQQRAKLWKKQVGTLWNMQEEKRLEDGAVQKNIPMLAGLQKELKRRPEKQALDQSREQNEGLRRKEDVLRRQTQHFEKINEIRVLQQQVAIADPSNTQLPETFFGQQKTRMVSGSFQSQKQQQTDIPLKTPVHQVDPENTPKLELRGSKRVQNMSYDQDNTALNDHGAANEAPGNSPSSHREFLWLQKTQVGLVLDGQISNNTSLDIPPPKQQKQQSDIPPKTPVDSAVPDEMQRRQQLKLRILEKSRKQDEELCSQSQQVQNILESQGDPTPYNKKAVSAVPRNSTPGKGLEPQNIKRKELVLDLTKRAQQQQQTDILPKIPVRQIVAQVRPQSECSRLVADNTRLLQEQASVSRIGDMELEGMTKSPLDEAGPQAIETNNVSPEPSPSRKKSRTLPRSMCDYSPPQLIPSANKIIPSYMKRSLGQSPTTFGTRLDSRTRSVPLHSPFAQKDISMIDQPSMAAKDIPIQSSRASPSRKSAQLSSPWSIGSPQHDKCGLLNFKKEVNKFRMKPMVGADSRQYDVPSGSPPAPKDTPIARTTMDIDSSYLSPPLASKQNFTAEELHNLEQFQPPGPVTMSSTAHQTPLYNSPACFRPAALSPTSRRSSAQMFANHSHSPKAARPDGMTKAGQPGARTFIEEWRLANLEAMTVSDGEEDRE